MTMAELGTAKQEGLQPIILLLNNGMYGTIRAHQERRYPGRVSATNLQNPDFVAIARAYGFFAERVKKTGNFAEVFAQAKSNPGGALIELMIDPRDISPFATLDLQPASG